MYLGVKTLPKTFKDLQDAYTPFLKKILVYNAWNQVEGRAHTQKIFNV